MAQPKKRGAQPPESHPDYPAEAAHLKLTVADLCRLLETAANQKGFPLEDRLVARTLKENQAAIIQQLKDAIESPYFGRVDFTPSDTGSAERYYIGKSGGPGITDWRAPIASLYYEGAGGRTSYKAPGGMIKGYLHLRRHLEVTSDRIIKLMDAYTDHAVTAQVVPKTQDGYADQFLLSQLERNAGETVRDIVATIQLEQHRVVRASRDRTVVVQGVAGSGKTVVALHRLAYLVYSYPKEVRPERTLVLAPSALFLNHIQDLLPELGVNRVQQTTFPAWATKVLGLDLKGLSHYDDSPEMRTLKGAASLVSALQDWLPIYADRLLPKEDLVVGGHPLITAAQIKTWFRRGGLTFVRHELDRIVADQEETLRQARKQLASLNNSRRQGTFKEVERLEKAIIHGREILRQVPAYRKRLQPSGSAHKLCVAAWQSFCTSEIAQITFGPLQAALQEAATRLSRGEMSAAVLPVLCWLRDHIFGVAETERYDHIAVDEAQDLTPIHYAVLAGRARDYSMTLVGDLAQRLTSGAEETNWDELLNAAVPADRVEQYHFPRSYRSTRQIVGQARRVLERVPTKVPLPEPVLRDGAEPVIRILSSEAELVAALHETLRDLTHRFGRVAVITPTSARAEGIRTALTGAGLAVTGGEPGQHAKQVPMMLDVHSAKGLEFDAVVVLDADGTHFPADLLATKRLYVAMTRALHELHVYAIRRISPLLTEADHIDDAPGNVEPATSNETGSATVTVCAGSPVLPGAHSSLGSALKAVGPGARILVYPGIYTESLVIEAPVVISGVGPAGAVVLQGDNGPALTLAAPWVQIRGLSVRSGQGKGQAVSIVSGRPHIEDCDLSGGAEACLCVRGEGAQPYVRQCQVSGSDGVGISFEDRAGGTVEDTAVFGNRRVGIELQQGADPLVRRCRLHDDAVGLKATHGARGRVEECEFMWVDVSDRAELVVERSASSGGGVRVGDTASVVVRSSRFSRGKGPALVVDAGGRGVVEGSSLVGMTGPAVEVRGYVRLQGAAVNRNTVGLVLHGKGVADVLDCDLSDNLEGGWRADGEATVRVHGRSNGMR
ncbi:MAG TPA: right-handed parallel beta-helix repeat-containing protein [Symbiobacteriaceae bacterium]|nr:right-handed parallel beta-helix repeat-containing protein [Symbiobacteriaceae bacterium]